MPWCPKCKEEYREGFVTCSMCDSELVTSLEGMDNNKVYKKKHIYYP
ncbi:hypothetical protein RH915_10190 [Serpentinicella sp. ANB-PHB4]|nr:hypothetical protein [Serpentinicella sp. ANB-PHB4]MDR5659858.1 hypothetical protein [Serpentinicella sp. ANB-PHB4]